MKYLGEYKEIENNMDLPLLKDNVSDVSCTNKDEILSYLKNKKFIKGAMPSLRYDIFTSQMITGQTLNYCDDEYCWDYETIYYFEKYNMKLPTDFINRAMREQK